MIINLTPHVIVVQLADGQQVSFPPAGPPARVTTTAATVGDADGVPIVTTVYGDAVGVPPPTDGVVFIASAMVAQQLRRADVLSPDTGPSAIRADGQIVAVRAFVRWA